MRSKWFRCSLFAALGVAAIVLSGGSNSTAAEDKKAEKLPTIKEIMKKGHAGADAYLAKIGDAAKGGKWEDAADGAKGLAFFGESLGKLEPPKGEKKSWEELTKKYAEATKAVSKAVEDKDAKATASALGAISKSCGTCHGAHKPK